MAAITQRTWTSRGVNGRRVKHTAWGFTIYRTDGKRVRRYDVAWSREDAEQELARHQLGIVPEAKTAALPTSSFTFGQAVERYLQIKARKRSPEHDRLYLGQLQAALGASTPLVQLTASRISAYKAERLAAINSRTGRPYAAASINRPLAVLRHLLRLAHEEWGELPAMPKVRLEREAEGRTRYLADDEQVRLLQACEAVQESRATPAGDLPAQYGRPPGRGAGLDLVACGLRPRPSDVRGHEEWQEPQRAHD
jgi:hypothetical protein